MNTTSVIQALKDATTNPTSVDPALKAQLMGACSAFVATSQPVEIKLMEMLFAPLKATALRLAIDMGLFDAATANGSSAISLEDLSTATRCEALLIKRIMRVLVDMKLFNELDQNVFQATAGAALYKSDAPLAQIIIHWTTHSQQIIKLPDYFAEKGYESPDDSRDCPFQYAMNTKLHNFEWIAEHPRIQHAFNVMMTIRTQRSIDAKWYEVYPIQKSIEEAQGTETFLVDIGGGVGHQVIDFKEQHSDAGHIIVQDIEPVVKSIKSLPDGIEAMVADFFKPQPIKGAKYYFVAHCLHDWPDKEAKIILGHVRDAMTSDSVLLLSEIVMPERDVSFMTAAIDLTMMAAFASLERTEKQFRELLDSVGLELIKVWSEEKAGGAMLSNSVLEARLKPGIL